MEAGKLEGEDSRWAYATGVDIMRFMSVQGIKFAVRRGEKKGVFYQETIMLVFREKLSEQIGRWCGKKLFFFFFLAFT